MGEVHSQIVPFEPLFTLKVAVELIPMQSLNALRMFLTTHKAEFPPLYAGGGWHIKRFLKESEILKIREMVYSTTYRRKSRNIIESIIARATG